MFDYKWDVTEEELAVIASSFKDFTPIKIMADGQELYVYQNLTAVPLSDSNRMFLAPVSDDPMLASLQTFVWAPDRKAMYIERPIDSRADAYQKGNALQFAVETCLMMIKKERREVAKAEHRDEDRWEFIKSKTDYYDAMLRKVDFVKSNQCPDDDRSLGSIIFGVDD